MNFYRHIKYFWFFPYIFRPMALAVRIKYLRVIIYFCILFICLYMINLTVRFSITQKNRTVGNGTKVSMAPLPRLPIWASDNIVKKFSSENNSGFGHSDNLTLLSCQLPQLQPFHSSVLNLISEELPPLICVNGEFPLLFKSTSDPSPKLIPVFRKESSTYSNQGETVESCCFRRMRKVFRIGASIEVSPDCRPLSLETETDIPLGWDYVAVECMFHCSYGCHLWNLRLNPWRIVDFHAFFHDASTTTASASYQNYALPGTKTPDYLGKTKEPNNNKPNVIILALDAMSQMNFLRTMPEVYYFLKNNLSAIEMMGYHKIGGTTANLVNFFKNTLPNIGPLLTKRKVVKTSYGPSLENCGIDNLLDNCPFIWKRFKSAGYRTLFAEDGVGMSLFDLHKLDFAQPPTDYYFRTLAQAAKLHTAHEIRSFSEMCYGPRPAFNVLIDYMVQMALSMEMNNTPFFQFALTGSVTHEFLNGGRLIVNSLLESLLHLHYRGVFNNTILIIMSDHGSRLNTIRSFAQGFLEDRFPMLYIALPPWFQITYPTAYSNLLNNTKRLVTVWDVHQTLEDIVNMKSSIAENKIKLRHDSASTKENPGMSLFLPVPLTRTCETAGIPEDFCSCNLSLTPVPLNTSIITAGAKYAVEHINNMLKEGSYSSCALFAVENILHAEKINIPQENYLTTVEDTLIRPLMYRIVFATRPGDARFEAVLRANEINDFRENKDIINATATVGRINVFKEHSSCIEDKAAKPYCYCIN